MSSFLRIVPVALSLFLAAGDDCAILPNGHYRIIYTFNSAEKDSRMEIENNQFHQYWDDGKSAKGAIRGVGSCTLEFEYFNRNFTIDTSDLGKRIYRSFGDTCMELKSQREDTILFRSTYTGNLHITINKGMIIKIN
jgi:hypothetical protein